MPVPASETVSTATDLMQGIPAVLSFVGGTAAIVVANLRKKAKDEVKRETESAAIQSKLAEHEARMDRADSVVVAVREEMREQTSAITTRLDSLLLALLRKD